MWTRIQTMKGSKRTKFLSNESETFIMQTVSSIHQAEMLLGTKITKAVLSNWRVDIRSLLPHRFMHICSTLKQWSRKGKFRGHLVQTLILPAKLWGLERSNAVSMLSLWERGKQVPFLPDPCSFCLTALDPERRQEPPVTWRLTEKQDL